MNKRTLIIGCAVICCMFATPTFAKANHRGNQNRNQHINQQHHHKGNDGIRLATQIVGLVNYAINPRPAVVVTTRPAVVRPAPVIVRPQPVIVRRPRQIVVRPRQVVVRPRQVQYRRR